MSVVVAVYNPGPNIDDLLDSIDQQSLPVDEFEVIFVDDDSTDGSRERLQDWASSRSNIRVLHNTPNSGWPGRPRNLGIDAAQGEFLFFADNDDLFTPRALEWMYDYATELDADVVIAKEAGVGPRRSVSRELFRHNIADARLGRDPILALLTPHKLVRTSMVREHGIRFPEGRIRLEDHYFIVSCYFAARRISVLADKLCYYWMRREAAGSNAAFSSFDPAVYYPSVGRAMKVVESNTEPGPLRDQLYAHWYDKKLLAALRGSLLGKTPEYQESLLHELGKLTERFGLGEAQWPWLGAGARMRSHLLEHGTLDQLKVFAAAEKGVRSEVELDDVTWTDDGHLCLRLRARMVYADGSAVRMIHRDGAMYWDVADRVPGLKLPRVAIPEAVSQVRLHVLSTNRKTSDVSFVATTCEPMDGDVLAARAEAYVDVEQLAEAGVGTVADLRARLEGAGWASERRIPARSPSGLPGPMVSFGLQVRPYPTEGTSNLSIAVERQKPSTSAKPSERQDSAAILQKEVAALRRRLSALEGVEHQLGELEEEVAGLRSEIVALEKFRQQFQRPFERRVVDGVRRRLRPTR